MAHVPLEKLLIWQRAMELVEHIYKVTRAFPSMEMYGLTAQIRRAAVSVPSNIAEGRERESSRDFRHFLQIAQGSLAELHTQLMIAARIGYIDVDAQNIAVREINALRSMLSSFRRKVPPR